MANFKLLVCIRNLGYAEARDANRSAHVPIVKSHLSRIHLDLVGIAHADLHSYMIFFMLALERFAQAYRVKVCQIAVDNNHMFLREDKD